MKRFLLYLSALFLSVSFATAQTYKISPSTGVLTEGNTSSYEWVSNQTNLKLRATNEGGNVKNIYYISEGTVLSLNAYNANGQYYLTTYTISVPEDGGYKIAGYDISATAYKTVIVNGVEYKNGNNVSVAKNNIDGYSVSFTVERKRNDNQSTAAAAIDINDFIVTLEEVGGEAPVEYTVSAVASPAEGGVVTVNGADGETTTTGNVELEAVPAYGYKFVRWTVDGNEVATTAQYSEVVNSEKQFVAVFEKLTDTNDWYESIQKPTFNKLGNTTFVNAATLAGDVNAEVTGIQGGEIASNTVEQKCVTNAIEVAAGAEFNLNITYQLKWGDLAIYQIDNDGATKEYGYYYGSWEPGGSTEKVVQYIEEDGVSVTGVVDGACTVTYPIAINENHNPGDVIVVRAIPGVKNNAKNSAYEQGIEEGGYVDFLFVVSEAVVEKSYALSVTNAGCATLFLDFAAVIPADVEAYTVTGTNSGYVTLTKVEGDVLPANTGVIVKAAEGNYTFAYSAETPAAVENLLRGTTTDTYVEGAAYVLANGTEGIGLYAAELNKNATGEAGNTHFKNNANKAYLPVAEGASLTAAFYGFNWDGTTGVENVEVENVVKTIYDLTGRKVETISAPGIYIINGVKRVVR